MAQQVRPDWDLSAPGLRAQWDAGDHSRHYPYAGTVSDLQRASVH